MTKKFKTAFTMAELLISLTIIGVLAAIMLPSLSSNVNEKTLNTRRVALYSRLSQAMGLIDAISDVGKVNSAGQTIPNWQDTAAMTFVVEKLQQGLKVDNTCQYGSFKACGFADVISRANGSTTSMPETFRALVNSRDLNDAIPATKPVAFVTKNGESIALYYNPDCMTKSIASSYQNAESVGDYAKFVCINLVYDLNGLKAPNTFGKDMGVATVLYASSPDFAMPVPTATTAQVNTSQQGLEDAAAQCANGGYMLPTLEEMISLSINDWLLYGSDPLAGIYLTSSKKVITHLTESFASNLAVSMGISQLYYASQWRSLQYICVKKMTE